MHADIVWAAPSRGGREVGGAGPHRATRDRATRDRATRDRARVGVGREVTEASGHPGRTERNEIIIITAKSNSA